MRVHVKAERTMMRGLVASVGALVLGAGLLVGATAPVSAATGDASTFGVSFEGQPSASESVASGPDFIWSLDDRALQIIRVGLDGSVKGGSALPLGRYRGMCTSASGEAYVIENSLDRIARVSVTGTITSLIPPNDLRQNFGSDWNCAVDASGNVWLIGQLAGVNTTTIVKMTPDGTFTQYLVSNATMRLGAITNGPTGSDRMYFIFTDRNDQTQVGYITTGGQITSIPATAGLQARFITSVGQRVWAFAADSNANNRGSLLRLVDDSTIQQVQVPFDAGRNGGMIAGPGNTLWVTNSTGDQVMQFTADGAQVGAYPQVGLPVVPLGLTLGSDGNVWTGQEIAGVARISSGAVPESSTAPAITGATGSPLTPGSAAQVSSGTWRYLPTSYSYQWQLCATDQTSSCADIAGATTATYTPTQTEESKYLRAGVIATNGNGASSIAYSALVGVGAAPAPTPPPGPPTPTGPTASIGNNVTMELDTPRRQKRGKRADYEVVFSALDPQGTVTFTFRSGSKTATKSVSVSAGIAEYRWRVPKKWRKGRTTVTAIFVPAAGSAYQSAATVARVQVR
jgi:hypothetical protein